MTSQKRLRVLMLMFALGINDKPDSFDDNAGSVRIVVSVAD